MRLLAAVLMVFALARGSLAAACDFGCLDAGYVSASRPVARPAPKPAPRPAPTPAPKPAARPAPTPAPKPAAVAASMGLHSVTQVWAGDVVTRTGPVTTYTSNTVQQNAGTYAKQVATVGTGQKSVYDASLSNQRTTLTDGRAVSGDIYANYVWNGSTLRLDRYVFFQDDLEIARQAAARPTATPVPIPAPTPRPAPPPLQPAPTAAPVTPAPAVAVVTPRPVPSTPSPTATPRPRVVTAFIALAPQGDALSRIEVLRGRRVDLWPRALVDGAPGRVSSWTLAAGEVTALGPVAGSGDQPLAAMWDDVTASGPPFAVRFSVTVDVPGEGSRRVEASIDVVVRSPAIVE
jgi:hypothetical protein